MALLKTIKSQFGTDVSYWRIRDAQTSYDSNRSNFTLEGYPDKATRELEPKPQPMQTINFSLEGHDRSRFDAYKFLQKNKIISFGQEADFTDAVDV